jgi:group II intron reverse transcriptase/maturase
VETLRSDETVRELQMKLYLKAKAEPEFRFYVLYDKTYRTDFLWESYRRVKANGGTPGVDGETFEAIEERGLENYLRELQAELKEKRYKPSPVLRVYIPKPNGDKRPLGIPTIRDRIVQGSFKLVLEPIFEADFTERSFGFRPEKDAHDAIREVLKLLNWGCTEVYDVDLSKFFDTVDHEKLMKLIALRIVDSRILKVIRAWLSCGYVEDGQHRTPKQGTPQGGVISPLLANIYLNPMDKALVKSKLWWRDKGSVHLVRYADDFVLLANYGLENGKAIAHRILTRLGLKVNEAKTRQYSLKDSGSLEYLGFKFIRTVNWKKGNKFFLVEPSPKALNRIREKMRERISHKIPKKIHEQIANANPVLRGWVNYYRLGNPTRCFNKIRNFVNLRVRRTLQRRKGRAGYGFKRYDADFIYGKLGLFCDYHAQPI